jgi:hypothetical protein
VKLFSGTVNNPVTQVTDVAVKKRSMNEIGTVREAGNKSNKVPIHMADNIEIRIVRPGANLSDFLDGIPQCPLFN